MNYELIKVCGMREAENIRQVEALDPDWMGFIFWKKSKRNVSKIPSYLPTACKRVGVFVDESPDTIRRIAQGYALDLIQLHGQEPPEGLRHLRSLCSVYFGTTAVPRLIKAFNIATAEDLEKTKPYEGLADYFLFDTKGKMVGGNGEQFDWTVLQHYHGSTPFLLSGGIGPDDVNRVKSFHHPQCIGIDLNSRFETEPGLKDTELLSAFIKQIRI